MVITQMIEAASIDAAFFLARRSNYEPVKAASSRDLV
jgi:hypothetical protein